MPQALAGFPSRRLGLSDREFEPLGFQPNYLQEHKNMSAQLIKTLDRLIVVLMVTILLLLSWPVCVALWPYR
ncbi:hypothetical protein CP488_01234 [Chthonomonas calidirosea]|nr:hypothetical protein CP488_01234 [Chthonomonas calidirosea]